MLRELILLSVVTLAIGFHNLEVHPKSYNSCDKRDSDCVNCPPNANNNFTSLLILASFPSFVKQAANAQKIISKYDGIIQMTPLIALHTSINYFCCYNQTQTEIIENVMQNFTWYSFNITYTGFGCNLDHNGVIIYLHSLPDWESQDKLYAFVDNIQQLIEDAGVPINNPRQQTFHATLATVNYSYPVDDVITQLNSTTFAGGTVEMSWFEMNGKVYHAKN